MTKQGKKKRYIPALSRASSLTGVILAVCLVFGCAGGIRSVQTDFTPIASPPTGTYIPGKFVWNDLLTHDANEAKSFYGGLFGWTFDQRDGYVSILNKGQTIGGIVTLESDTEDKSAARWIPYLSVADIHKAESLVTQEGGIVHEAAEEMKNRGTGALVSDPQGAQIMLLRSFGGDPEDIEPPIGSWLWRELWSNNTATSYSFYQKLCDYRVQKAEPGYWLLTKGGEWRAGIRYVADKQLETRWVTAVRVADTERVARKTAELGGKVLMEPEATEDGGNVALISDPAGALLIVQQWEPESLAGRDTDE